MRQGEAGFLMDGTLANDALLARCCAVDRILQQHKHENRHTHLLFISHMRSNPLLCVRACVRAIVAFTYRAEGG